ncbi:hypothetical protein DERP_011803 [Dermatophagoides pteronyssinus]|uniref:Uncharacterized protein n=1 Tax=Dermatophagoides pteronyssinus TaxID=6956 RepID=A0ABQ8JR33_DERPT|nr:hypothetical protein DERP_011803 [Dermatophagoides pteronyssinus]
MHVNLEANIFSVLNTSTISGFVSQGKTAILAIANVTLISLKLISIVHINTPIKSPFQFLQST